MFTGIVKATGCVREIAAAAGGSRLTIEPSSPYEDLEIGESIAVNGVCLTAEPGSSASRLGFFLSAETLQKSSLGAVGLDACVNLERSLRAGDRLGGHFVMGHVDCVGRIAALDRDGEAWNLEVAYPASFRPYLAPKGSAAVDGISLTVVEVRPSSFTVAVIPHTVEATNLRARKPGDPVNLEADVLARYVAQHLAESPRPEKVDLELLKRAGFA